MKQTNHKLEDIPPKVKIEEFDVHFEQKCQKEADEDPGYKVIAVKNRSSYLVINHPEQPVLIENGTKRDSFPLPKPEYYLKACYINNLNSYMILIDNILYEQKIYQSKASRFMRISEMPYHLIKIHYSQKNKRLFIAIGNSQLIILNPKTKKIETSFQIENSNFLIFGKNDQRLACASETGLISFYKVLRNSTHRNNFFDFEAQIQLSRYRREKLGSFTIYPEGKYVFIQKEAPAFSAYQVYQIEDQNLVSRATLYPEENYPGKTISAIYSRRVGKWFIFHLLISKRYLSHHFFYYDTEKDSLQGKIEDFYTILPVVEKNEKNQIGYFEGSLFLLNNDKSSVKEIKLVVS